MWLPITVAVFFFARFVAMKVKNPIFNPLLISIAILIPVLVWFDVSFDTYYADNEWISYLLQPAVVALAYPLYEQLPQIRQNWRIIALACGVGSIASMFTASIIAVLLGADMDLIASLLGKSVTTNCYGSLQSLRRRALYCGYISTPCRTIWRHNGIPNLQHLWCHPPHCQRFNDGDGITRTRDRDKCGKRSARRRF